jgi:hypothetical protein
MMTFIDVLMVAVAAAVVVALFAVLWRERTSKRAAAVAVVSGLVLAAWAAASAVLARRGAFVQVGRQVPPVGIAIAVELAFLGAVLMLSPTLRGLLADRKNIIRLNVWRLLGAVFLLLMQQGQMPALWAWPAGVGDILIGLAAFPVARRLDEPGGTNRAIVFNLLGLADLVVAIGLGMMTSLGPTNVFHTTPSSQMATRFPLALVPTFLVPLAFMLHLWSLWQLRAGSARHAAPVAA